MNTQSSAVDLSDIQGLIMRGYTHPFSCHMIFQFDLNASEFIRKIYPLVQSAEPWMVKPAKILNIGLTASGIGKLKPKFQMNNFPPEFQAGPASPGSQQSLQDNGPSAPENWVFGNGTIPVDCVVHVYGMTSDDLTDYVNFVIDASKSCGFTEIFPIDGIGRLEQYQLAPNYIHFGYHDGIDQPSLSPSLELEPGQTYTNPANLNNFLVGYNSEKSYFQPTPVGSGVESIFSKNGCYSAFRMLYQDDQKFSVFLDKNAVAIAPVIEKSEEYTKEWLAAKLVGRWRNGCPLVLSPDCPDPNLENETVFGYVDDPLGLRCPISSHTRVANPRDTLGMLQSDTPIPRILRRGVPYGAPPKDNVYEGERGLIGLFLCGSLAAEFELISVWMNTNNFTDSLSTMATPPQDALLANRLVSGNSLSFSIPVEGPAIPPPKTISPAPVLPQFIVTKGSAYCLLPSLSALRSCFTESMTSFPIS